MNKYFLSFDCATKTFGYVFVRITLLENIEEMKNRISQIIYKENINSDDIKFVLESKKIVNESIKIIDSGCVDLFPGKANKEISTIDRIKKTSEYVSTLIPMLKDLEVTVLVEFQMSQNTQSKIVSIVLLTLFSKYECHLVYPSLKNKINFYDNYHYSKFISKYKSNYTANKQHALENFKQFEILFDQIKPISNKQKGHIADAFMQIFGFILFPTKKPIIY
jgi:hypothetical protein